MKRFFVFNLFTACAIAALILMSQAVRAGTKYDGVWSVVIITDSGTCDRAYRYSLRVANGQIRYESEPGGLDIKFSGRIDDSGRLSVSLSRGDQKASGKGRVSQDSGTGQWSGSSSTAQCSGRWEAERRQT